ncbi:hypothetical protein PMIN01_10432 [Paraphaeosphaeria minitans]|uniref:Uncharacterized protein n=1 Tax=Paraphaeosphaeria minitans TaxID=565426 RepID=A0A9P6GAH9_9PLEO|nr:hypothetical protein PMIN01_10432 [Paraphaeosphaeria minitans]
MPTLQYVLPVSVVAHLALEPTSSAVAIVPPKLLEPSWMLTLMILLELVAYPCHAPLPLYRWKHFSRIAVHDFFGSFFDPVDICDVASTSLPFLATHIAELRFANAAACQ